MHTEAEREVVSDKGMLVSELSFGFFSVITVSKELAELTEARVSRMLPLLPMIVTSLWLERDGLVQNTLVVSLKSHLSFKLLWFCL